MDHTRNFQHYKENGQLCTDLACPVSISHAYPSGCSYSESYYSEQNDEDNRAKPKALWRRDCVDAPLPGIQLWYLVGTSWISRGRHEGIPQEAICHWIWIPLLIQSFPKASSLGAPSSPPLPSIYISTLVLGIQKILQFFLKKMCFISTTYCMYHLI